MASDTVVVVAGMGEVGRPLFRILSGKFECVEVDIKPVSIAKPCSVLHICYPFQVPDFIGTTLGYINKYQPALTIINSTVGPGTTRKTEELARRPADPCGAHHPACMGERWTARRSSVSRELRGMGGGHGWGPGRGRRPGVHGES